MISLISDIKTDYNMEKLSNTLVEHFGLPNVLANVEFSPSNTGSRNTFHSLFPTLLFCNDVPRNQTSYSVILMPI